MNKLGFISVAAVSPKNIKIGNPSFNTQEIIRLIKECETRNSDIVVFPELSITGYTCGDLFFQTKLLDKAMDCLYEIAKHVTTSVVFVGLPIRHDNQIFNCAAILNKKEILGIIPKTHIPNYNEFYELRHFSSSTKIINNNIFINSKKIPFSTDILIECADYKNKLLIGCEICEDAWVPITPGAHHCLNGANIIVNLSASNELASKKDYRSNLIKMHSATNICGYIYSSASMDESTSDTVFSGHKMICENGSILKESIFLEKEEIIEAQIDIERINNDRIKSTSFMENVYKKEYIIVKAYVFANEEIKRDFSLTPFVPSSIKSRAEEILNIQCTGLAQRMKKINCWKAVIGVSGGLDSTLALLSTIRAFDMNNIDRKNIIGITMPCFGTTDKTLNNSLKLMEFLGITGKTINIKNACIQHFKDIGHKEDDYDITYENTQARERTQVLFDMANQSNAIVIGTGDLSEIALGWATFGGDWLSNYNVNSSIPKTLIRHLINYYYDYYAEKGDNNIADCLMDIINTPISPELLPPNKDGSISQITENSVGNYNINDFILYYHIRFGFSPEKIFKMLNITVKKENLQFSEIDILDNMLIFYKRFFSQQFKRNCVPDGIKVGSVSLSPRADWRMPSDASNEEWINEIENLKRHYQI